MSAPFRRRPQMRRLQSAAGMYGARPREAIGQSGISAGGTTHLMRRRVEQVARRGGEPTRRRAGKRRDGGARIRGCVDRPPVEDIGAGRSESGFDAPEHSRHRGRRDRVCHHVGIIARIQLAQGGTTCRQTSPLLTNSPDASPAIPPPGYVHSRVSASINATGTKGDVAQLAHPGGSAPRKQSRPPAQRAYGRACTSRRWAADDHSRYDSCAHSRSPGIPGPHQDRVTAEGRDPTAGLGARATPLDRRGV